METFEGKDMRGATFREVDLRDSSFYDIDLRGADIREAFMVNVRMRGVLLADVDIDAGIEGPLVINGVDVGPLIEAELDRRQPDRVKMRPTTADGFREGWDTIERLWAGTVDWARTFTPEQLNESVDDEWSFIQTLRHLTYATDCWVNRVILGDPNPFHPLGLPFSGDKGHPDIHLDLDARPSLDEVLEVRAGRQETVRRVVADLTEERLEERTEPVHGPGWPPPDSYALKDALLTILNEEWHHRQFALRDLAIIESRG